MIPLLLRKRRAGAVIATGVLCALYTSHAAAEEALHVAASVPVTSRATVAATSPLDLGGATRRARMRGETRLVLDGPVQRLPLTVPADASLAFGFGAHSGFTGQPKHSVRFRVTFEVDGETHALWSRRVLRRSSHIFGRWYDVRVSLAALAGRTGTLGFEANSTIGRPASGSLWSKPRVIYRTPRPGPNVILVSLDTLRADRLGIYGPSRDTSPPLAAMARDGVLFRRAFATSNWTLPSHASLFTGQYPWRHGSRHFGLKSPIPPHLTTLPEALAERGYATYGFVGGVFVSAQLGFDRGFDRYVDPGYATFSTVPFATNLRMTLGLLQHHSERPFFLFLHTYQVHMPYKPRAPWNRAFDPDYAGPYRNAFTSGDYAPYRWTDALDAEVVDHIAALYDGGIRQTDDELGILWQVIRESEIADQTCIFVTSDHGDEFMEHGNLFHHNAKVFDELIRVPLVAWCPAHIATGHVVEEPVSLVDVLPTLLELTGSRVPDGLDGSSLMTALRGEPLPTGRTVYAEVDGSTIEKTGSVTALRTRRHKLVSSTLGGGRVIALYDLEADPGEQSDVAEQHPETVRRLTERLDARRPFDASAEAGAVPDFSADPALRERLRELGYIQ